MNNFFFVCLQLAIKIESEMIMSCKENIDFDNTRVKSKSFINSVAQRKIGN